MVEQSPWCCQFIGIFYHLIVHEYTISGKYSSGYTAVRLLIVMLVVTAKTVDKVLEILIL